MALGDGSAIRLTISRYYTPTGRSIQRPYDNGHSEDYYHDYYKRLSNGEFNNEENIEVADSLKFTTPKGKIVYGGGGIIPDIFVPSDTSIQNETLNYIKRRGYISYFVFEELDKDRSVYNDMIFNDFKTNFLVSDEVIDRFQDYLNLRERTNITFVAYYDTMKQLIKAALAEQLYGDNEGEQIANEKDEMIKEVIFLSQEKEQ
jgi:carboxyl-terminal processing protease